MSKDIPVYPWKELKRETVFTCRIFDVTQRHTEELSKEENPRRGNFFVIDPPDWANIVAITPNEEIVLIEQWRQGTESVTIEIPGGMMDPGENPEESAKRELQEETGFTSNKWFHLGHVSPNAAIQSNRCHTFLALDAQQTAATNFDAMERIRLVLVPYEDIPKMVVEAKIDHAIVLSALYLAYAHLKEGKILK